MTKETIIADLKEGLWAELRALDLCRFLKKILASRADRSKIELIIKDETRHVKIVKNLIKEIERNYKASQNN